MKTFILYIKRMGRLLLELIAKEIIDCEFKFGNFLFSIKNGAINIFYKDSLKFSLNSNRLMHEYVLV